ncbi:Tripartite ATP-independent periplasmic transporter, DctQ component [Trichormus variabilis ATCC 29413]|uniref:Tripartite ATP-independent periplasmic transporter, DctQ component n=2 Tax=Anabaena variabilis TaxID=264691 RepID=Q3MES7_TRIV2|nr:MULTISPECIES: TRAP transporter small permease subunit [Nostocaceae]ABA20509.1 Tripartite ATP-independent periplasmic transporter, DctQ component [Trichormus variabilis ATCC 29413]MBC1214674.1 TRAP transporter small permease subunit [Trichormus variabilis ARAD]MBC1257674.1 TRAP transporter small permease subunit [Trichormus variabilis V5]MBC1267008.1 TRAP transporter small permease subunit [Trichormus variabilis FSR]MBC1300846.1 TRAP transporter small permease subunit [Trichormus variabilis 
MEKLLKISRIIDAFTERVGRYTSWLVLVMVILGVWNVVGRYLGRISGNNLTSNAYIEAQWYIFDVIFFLGAAYTLKHNEHVRVDIFYSNWQRRRKAIADFLGTIFFLIPFSIIVIFVSWDTIVASWQIGELSPDPGGLPRYPIKAMIIVGFVLLIIQGISQAIKNLAIIQGRLEPQEENHDAGL